MSRCPVCGLGPEHDWCEIEEAHGTGPWSVQVARATTSEHPTFAGALRRLRHAYIAVVEGVSIAIVDSTGATIAHTTTPSRAERANPTGAP